MNIWLWTQRLEKFILERYRMRRYRGSVGSNRVTK